MEYQVTRKQMAFLKADADEVLFGGAAGGGKSHAQVLDALVYALRYPGSKQLILRRTFPELDKSLIRLARELYPAGMYEYNATKHGMRFLNGSLLDFGYCDNQSDVYKYQSAEYDVIRFDELTHFTEEMYIYLISRCRGVNGYPKQIKSTTNPGGVGHAFVKARFVDAMPAGELYRDDLGTRLYIPARVTDNVFLMAQDPGYIKRLERLNENDKRALLHGDWDVFEGQYFTEFDRRVHVVAPFPIPAHWKKYFAMDYGLDMLAGYFIAVDPQGKAYVFRELYQSNLIVSQAIDLILAQGIAVDAYIAPPDLWNRKSDTGRSTAELFALRGIPLVRADNDRVQGWLDLREYLRVRTDEQGRRTANLLVFDTCVNLIRTLPAVQYDRNNRNDVANTPHELTHAPDAIRYFVAARPAPHRARRRKPLFAFAFERRQDRSVI